MAAIYRIGVISDTHGLLRPEAAALLRGVDQIIHAGDVGRWKILNALNRLAPTVAVRGNVDTDDDLPLTAVVTAGGARLYVLHSLSDLEFDPAAAGFQDVISGHSHQPVIEWRGGVLYLNPGSAGPRRFTLPVTLAYLTITDGQLTAEIVPVVDERSR